MSFVGFGGPNGRYWILEDAPGKEKRPQVGDLWFDEVAGVLKYCSRTSPDPIEFTAVDQTAAGGSGVDRIIANGETVTVVDGHCLILSSYLELRGNGTLELQGDAELAVI